MIMLRAPTVDERWRAAADRWLDQLQIGIEIDHADRIAHAPGLYGRQRSALYATLHRLALLIISPETFDRQPLIERFVQIVMTAGDIDPIDAMHLVSQIAQTVALGLEDGPEAIAPPT